MVRSGTAANATGPHLFLRHGMQIKNKSLSEHKLVEWHGAQHGSKFWLNKSGYMTNKNWLTATKQLCKGCERPFRVVEHKIMLVKEE
eukprot:6799084-Ditylum_brightwellii.AAC.1